MTCTYIPVAKVKTWLTYHDYYKWGGNTSSISFDDLSDRFKKYRHWTSKEHEQGAAFANKNYRHHNDYHLTYSLYRNAYNIRVLRFSQTGINRGDSKRKMTLLINEALANCPNHRNLLWTTGNVFSLLISTYNVVIATVAMVTFAMATI